MTDRDHPLVERALAVARETHQIEVPDRATAIAKLAMTREPTRPSWWTVAVPTIWRSALAVNAVGALVLTWLLLRDAPSPSAAPSVLDAMIEDETDALFTGLLGNRSPR